MYVLDFYQFTQNLDDRVMEHKSLLKGKKVLLVDDEVDILETLLDILTMCEVKTASDFETAKALLENEHFDIAVLDIMGVDGYTLLEIAKNKGIIAIMLTAHALSLENTFQSFERGADLYVPKEELFNIAVFLEDVLEGRSKGRHSWWKWMERFGPFYDKRFGEDWKKKSEKLLERLKYRV